MAEYFPLVFDAAHWWLNVAPRLLAEFPAAKIVGLMRETDTCVESFLRMQGRGAGSMNNWAPPDNVVWRPTRWDPTYPKYPLPFGVQAGSEEAYLAKTAMITRYVTEYNQALSALAAAHEHRVLLIRTEDLNAPTTASRLRAFVGHEVTMPAQSLNVGNDNDGAQRECWY
jgi:hypothetical protein